MATISLPVGAYTSAATDEATAYTLAKAYYEKKTAMTEANPWWSGVTPDMLSTLGAKLHPGALKYYQEAGIDVPDTPR